MSKAIDSISQAYRDKEDFNQATLAGDIALCADLYGPDTEYLRQD